MAVMKGLLPIQVAIRRARITEIDHSSSPSLFSNGQTGFRLLGLAAALIFSRDALKEVLFLLREALHSTVVYLLKDRIQFETFAFECRQFGAAAARASAEVPVSEGLQRKKKGIKPQVDQQKAGSTPTRRRTFQFSWTSTGCSAAAISRPIIAPPKCASWPMSPLLFAFIATKDPTMKMMAYNQPGIGIGSRKLDSAEPGKRRI